MSPAGLNACITLVNLTEAVTGTSSKAVESLNLSKTKTKFCISATAGHKCAGQRLLGQILLEKSDVVTQ